MHYGSCSHDLVPEVAFANGDKMFSIYWDTAVMPAEDANLAVEHILVNFTVKGNWERHNDCFPDLEHTDHTVVQRVPFLTNPNKIVKFSQIGISQETAIYTRGGKDKDNKDTDEKEVTVFQT